MRDAIANFLDRSPMRIPCERHAIEDNFEFYLRTRPFVMLAHRDPSIRMWASERTISVLRACSVEVKGRFSRKDWSAAVAEALGAHQPQRQSNNAYRHALELFEESHRVLLFAECEERPASLIDMCCDLYNQIENGVGLDSGHGIVLIGHPTPFLKHIEKRNRSGYLRRFSIIEGE
ncbi:MAG: hypothetical protein JNK58_09940 [Phycisphaerae bacterium]|nr:hypothetical protein [Phycisphaerae bacterium]